MSGRTEFFNYGFANLARNERVTADSLFNLGSVGKLFAPTLLAEAVKRGELSLDDSVAKYVTESQKGGDIRRVTLGQLASHTSGLPRAPQQYEGWHRGNTRGRTLFASYEFVEGWSELRAWETVSLIQRCHGFVARGARTPIQHSICGVNARTDHRTAWNELYRAALATGLAWARRAGLRPGRAPCRPSGRRVGNIQMARRRLDLFIVAGHGDVPRCEHGRSSPTMARWRMRWASRSSPCSP